MRDPSLHIKLSDIITVLKKLYPDDVLKYDWELFSKELFKAGKKYTCTNRQMVISNDKLMRIADKISSTDNVSVIEFQSIFIKVRRSLKHVGVKPIKPGEKDWPILKNIATNANLFCSDFEIDKKEGYVIYCKIAFKILKKFNLSHIPNLHKDICEYYMAEKNLLSDPYEKLTFQAYKAYSKAIIERVGISIDYYDNPIVYQEFTKIPPIVKRLGGNIVDYIISQFEGLAWTGSYPDPSQLSGDKAEARYVKYCYKNNIRLK